MSSYIQTALMQRLQSQLRRQTAYENATLYLDLRHRIEQIKLINEHFDERDKTISKAILDSYEKYSESIKINQMRFDLCIDERMELMFDTNVVHFTKYDSPDVDRVLDRMLAHTNDFLFFKNAYTKDPMIVHDSDNTYFYYLVLLSMIALVFKI